MLSSGHQPSLWSFIAAPCLMTLVALAVWVWQDRPSVREIHLPAQMIPSADSTSHHFDDKARQLYLDKCARCHGEKGEGTDEFQQALFGDLPVDELAQYLHATMPEDDPDDCVDEEARLVARYIHEQFYSPQARQRIEQPERSFSRLTTRQLKESIADLIGYFDVAPYHPPERGLNGVYFASRHWNNNRKLSEQVDRSIDFADQVPHFDPTGEYAHLGEKPKAENQMGEGFSAYWNGSVLAPQTGWYDIKVESKNGFQLWINNLQNPLIDRKVRSDDVVEHGARVFMLAGRAYRIKLDFFSYPDPPAKIRLLWRPPQGVEGVVPNRYLLPQNVPEALAVTTTFPADDASSGYERGISISQEWDEAVTQAAIEAADWVSDRIWHYAKSEEQADDRLDKVKSFCRQFVEMAFAKPINDPEYQFFVNQHFENELALKDQVKRVVILAIKSPRFLYPELQLDEPDFRIARRLALAIWDSLPDKDLFELAKQKQLKKPEIVESQLWRMLSDPRARGKLQAFFHDWLNIEKGMNATKDLEMFAGFDEQLLFDCRQSLEIFLDEIIRSEEADARQIFASDYLMANRRMAEFYGFEFPQPKAEAVTPPAAENTDEATADSDKQDVSNAVSQVAELPHQPLPEFVRVTPAYSIHAGIITHPYLMMGLAHYQHSSPIHRGVFLARKLLGRTLKQPNENFEPLSEDFNPSLSTRERVEFQTKDANCMSCHSIINPLGFSLENFDAVGRYRTSEKEKPINVATQYKTPAGEAIEFNSPRELAEYLTSDQVAQRSFVKQFFQHYVRQPIDAYGPSATASVHQSYANGKFNLRILTMAVARTTIAEYLETESTD